jgi:hypothetical protein
MNERIKELKKQAWEYAMAVHDGHIVPPLDKEVWPIDKVLDEKFAELIVRECMRICKDHPSIIFKNEWDADVVSPDIVSRLESHFGVEE